MELARAITDEFEQLSPLRDSAEGLTADAQLVSSQATLVALLNALSSQTVVLNPQRQLVWATYDFLELAGAEHLEALLGSRFGEILSCVHARESGDGCGHSESCEACGALRTIRESRHRHRKTSGECRLTIYRSGVRQSLDLQVTSTPWQLDGRLFYVVTVRDQSADKRRLALERIFFHDLVNSAGGVAGALEVLTGLDDLNEGKELIELSKRASHDLLDEVMGFRQLRSAEAGSLGVSLATFKVIDSLNEVLAKMKHHPVATGKTLTIEQSVAEAEIETDRLLLQRILVNMVKNALEASAIGGSVVLRAKITDEQVVFSVHNDGEIPHEVQLQIFQRSFSTKDAGRGLGTYSMKLLGEATLGGRVTFRSGPTGTDFILTLPRRFRATV